MLEGLEESKRDDMDGWQELSHHMQRQSYSRFIFHVLGFSKVG